jgi:hypothetical protein
VQLADGTIVVPRFGDGTDGDIAVVHPDGSSGVVPKLDVARRRIGLTVAGDGSLYDTYFVMNGKEHVGGVARVDLTAGTGETDLTAGLQKPVGVLASRDVLLIAEQGAGRIVSLPTKASGSPIAPTPVAALPSADLLAAGPDGSLFTGGRDGAIHQIARNGATSVFASGYSEVRGVAFDPKHRRLFFVDHVEPGTAGRSSSIVIRDVP